MYIRGVENNNQNLNDMKNDKKYTREERIENEVFEQLVGNVKAVIAFFLKGRILGHDLKNHWLPVWYVLWIALIYGCGCGWFYLVDLINHARWGI